MIKTFRSKGLGELFEHGTTAKIDQRFHGRIRSCLDALDAAQMLRDVDLPGFRLHPLQGFNPTRYSIWVNGPWRVTFEFDGVDVVRVDFEQYH